MILSETKAPRFELALGSGSLALLARALVLLLVLSGGRAVSADAPLRQPGRWAQDYLDRKPDPAVRFGVLPNGLRYALLHNEAPRGGVSMRLRIGSGSIQERDGEEGLAHFLEHMAFRGSVNIADGEAAKMLERQGLRFGPDINANTGPDRTIYQFNFPKADASALDVGFTLFREIGERLTISSAALEAEKGVILSEERARDNPAYRGLKADLENTLAGSRAVARWPIGFRKVIETATPDRLARYYKANYRPDNATIVVVGDIDVDKLEQEIKARFSDWEAAGQADAIDLGAPAPLRPAAEHVEPGAPDRLTLAWVKPSDERAHTEALDREELLQQVALMVLNNRLADEAAKPGAPMVEAQAARTPSFFGVAALTQIVVAASPDKWRDALALVVAEQRQLLENGVSAPELQRAATMALTAFRKLVAQAPTRRNASLADALVAAASEDDLFTSPDQDLAFVEPILAALKCDEVNATLHEVFLGKGPVLFRSAQETPLTAAVLEKALGEELARPLVARVAEQASDWPYVDFGAPSVVLSWDADKELAATFVRFSNGTRLIAKRTAWGKDQVHVKVSLGKGEAGMTPSSAHALWATKLAVAGGTGKLGYGDINRWAQTTARTVSALLIPERRDFALTGVTRRADLVAELQLLAAYSHDPGFRPEMQEKLAAMAAALPGQLESSAGPVFRREADRVLAGGDARFVSIPRPEDIAETKASDIADILLPALAGPADVTIVGDVSVEEAVEAVQTTFGAGAASPRAKEPDVHILMPEGRAEPWVVYHRGRADQAMLGQYWTLPDFYSDPKLARVASVAAAILKARLFDMIRETLGIAYSLQAKAVASMSLPGQGFIGAEIETPPEKFEVFRSRVREQVADLAEKPVSPDELQRAQKPLSEARLKDLETNSYWLSSLASVLRDPRARRPILEHAGALDGVTPEDIQSFFRQRLSGRRPIEIIARAMSDRVGDGPSPVIPGVAP